MKYERTQLADTSTLRSDIAARMQAVRDKRDALGLNVQWTREDGTLDTWSFATVERRDGFVANLQRRGIACVISN